jgi:hypothetical protein
MNEYKEKQKAEKDETLLIRCRELKRAGDKGAAVKLYRAEKRCALKPAMDAIDALMMPNVKSAA